MVHRIALIGGAVAAIGILVLAVGAGSLFARSGRGVDSVSASAATAEPTARTQVDTVYVKAAPPQRVIHVTQTSPPSTSRQSPRVVVINKPPHGGDDEDSGHRDGGSEGGDD
jgi:hypothetical protein